jgi:PLP dependent protein
MPQIDLTATVVGKEFTGPDRAKPELIMSPIASALQAVHRRIAEAATLAGRSHEEVSLLAVSKTFPAGAVREAYSGGQRAFGENYVQEALAKMDALRDLPDIEWHLIGPLQSNKTTQVAAAFAWVHTIDRLKIAQRLSAARLAGQSPLACCVQVNISGEASKSGVDPAAALALAHELARLPRLALRGFMGITEPTPDAVRQRAQFGLLRGLLEQARNQGLTVDTLSMGMTADLESAIAEGATLVRVGTAIFGAREKT